MGRALPLREVFSGIFGSISVTASMSLTIPQLLANYRVASADGLSTTFLTMWLVGDACNLLGALCTQLAPTATILASCLFILDSLLLIQTFYYNVKNSRYINGFTKASSVNSTRLPIGESEDTISEPSEAEPLLGARRISFTSFPHGPPVPPVGKAISVACDTSESRLWLHNVLGLLAVYSIGTCGWFVSYGTGIWDAAEPDLPKPPAGKMPLHTIGPLLGYASAALYLCAEIPQILKNYNAKSCEGLSLLFFMFSFTNNLMYGLSLLVYSQEKDYLINALPWLLGSLGAMMEDATVFAQFQLYRTG
ncbi:hypothetical protein NQ176_g9320 [Zarea fungicola]|uniref:Uncharacterized protein n=1 Tax=Zarea fungicola TaxID=93591 RepID=A0ACC1MND5_9HYPO|nr:hypothetical protein NQ176_g9320 [Lecanicillium fungicola]